VDNQKDWKQDLEVELNNVSNKKEDLIKIINLCEDFSNDIQNNINSFSEQIDHVESIKSQYIELYKTRFKDNPPQRRPKLPFIEVTSNVTVLKTREQKRNAVRTSTLAVFQANPIFSANDVNEDLIKRGISLDVKKPQAVISTIINSFNDFKKISGKKKGMFTGLANEKNEEVINK
jgi:hypothetical protein